jgi:hypothetical protein
MRNIVYIEWYDSYGCSSRWEDVKTQTGGVMLVKTIGFVVYEDEAMIKIAGSYGEETDDTIEQCNGVMAIPKCCIKTTKEVIF